MKMPIPVAPTQGKAMTLQDEKLTTRQLAIELKRAPETLVRWRSLRMGPPYIRIQGRVLYSRTDVDRWLQDQSVQAGAA